MTFSGATATIGDKFCADNGTSGDTGVGTCRAMATLAITDTATGNVSVGNNFCGGAFTC